MYTPSVFMLGSRCVTVDDYICWIDIMFPKYTYVPFQFSTKNIQLDNLSSISFWNLI